MCVDFKNERYENSTFYGRKGFLKHLNNMSVLITTTIVSTSPLVFFFPFPRSPLKASLQPFMNTNYLLTVQKKS